MNGMIEKRDLISVVVPVYNESRVLDEFLERLIPVLEGLAETYEIVCVNDGSTDDTLERLFAWQARVAALVVVDLSRNFGKEQALTAGLDTAAGDAVIPIDADLQDPPELIPQLIERWREGYDVVSARRKSRRGESGLRRLSARLFYRLFSAMSDIPVPLDTGDFRLLDRKVVEALAHLPERTRFMKGLFAWVGFRQTDVLFDRDPRSSGQSTWSYLRLWRFAMDGITSFSTFPLRFLTFLGGTLAGLTFLYGLFLIIRTLVIGVDVPGYASLLVTVLFLGGVNLLAVGLLGEYIGRIFMEVKQRPAYVIREVHRPGSGGGP